MAPPAAFLAAVLLAALQACVTLVFALTSDPWLWIALRLANGLINAMQFVIVESWVLDRTPAQLRGRMMSVYVVCSRAGLVHMGPRCVRPTPENQDS